MSEKKVVPALIFAAACFPTSLRPRRPWVTSRAQSPRGVPASASSPIPMIEGIMLPGGMWNLHAAMERESRDVEWANQMEREFSTYFASKSELGRNFGQPSVVCRSQSCEVQAIGYGPRAFDTWAAATQDLRDQLRAVPPPN